MCAARGCGLIRRRSCACTIGPRPGSQSLARSPAPLVAPAPAAVARLPAAPSHWLPRVGGLLPLAAHRPIRTVHVVASRPVPLRSCHAALRSPSRVGGLTRCAGLEGRDAIRAVGRRRRTCRSLYRGRLPRGAGGLRPRRGRGGGRRARAGAAQSYPCRRAYWMPVQSGFASFWSAAVATLPPVAVSGHSAARAPSGAAGATGKDGRGQQRGINWRRREAAAGR